MKLPEPVQMNPFTSPVKENNFYELGGQNSNLPIPKEVEEHLNYLNDFVLQSGYPCIGAQASLNSQNVCIGVFNKMDEAGSIASLAHGLFEFTKSVKESQSLFLSYIAVFPEDEFATELEFEQALWTLLNTLYSLQKKHFN